MGTGNFFIRDLVNAAQAAGLTMRNCGRGHYQLIGGSKLVNFYDTANKKIYVDGERKGRSVSSVAQVIEATGAKQKSKASAPTLTTLELLEQNKELRTDIKTLCDWIHMSASGITPPNERTVKVADVVNKYRDKAMGRLKGLELRYNSQGTLEIVKWETKTCFTVASWQKSRDGAHLIFCGTRPLEVDQAAFWELAKQGYEQLKLETRRTRKPCPGAACDGDCDDVSCDADK